MIKYNGMVLMTEEEYEELLFKKNKTTDTKVRRKDFVELWNAESIKDAYDLDNRSYGCNVTVHWNGYYCNCGDGATAYNNIICGVADADEELDDWEGDD